MEAAHACEDADLRRLANQVDELIVDRHSDASENWLQQDRKYSLWLRTGGPAAHSAKRTVTGAD